jgi:exo-poly-alpha-galacturonosidase
MISKQILTLGLGWLVAVSAASVSAAEPSRHLLTDHGAIGDDTTLNTIAIQTLIDQLAMDGGGVIVVPAGTFRSGALFFKQGVDLHLEAGGVLKGTTNPADYPVVNTRWEGEERAWISAFINFRHMHDVRLTGAGTIDGAGDEWMDKYPRRRRRPPQADATANAVPALLPGPPRPRGRPRMIGFENCSNVVASGFNLRNQASWGLYVLYSEEVRLENLNIQARHDIPSSDGIDIDSSRHVIITGVDIDVNDDCISIKSGKDEDGRRVNRPAEDILIENCRFRYGHGGVAMGSETSGGIRNVEIRNCIMDSDNWAPIRFKSQPSRGGVVENITYRDIQLNGTRKAFEFNMAWRMVNPKPPTDPLPIVRNVRIINVSGTVGSVGDMSGLEGSPIQGVTFENCNIKAERPFVLRHVEGLDLSGLHIEIPEGTGVVHEEG